MRIRFQIRDLLWLTALIALAVGWWVDHRALVGYPEVTVYHLKYADADETYKVLQSILASAPGVRISLDAKTNAITAVGPIGRQMTIRQTIEKLDSKP